MEFILILLLIQGIVFGFFCSYIAGEKNRDKFSWFFLGFLFSILAVFALIAVPKIGNQKIDGKKLAGNSFPSTNLIAETHVNEILFNGERNLSSLMYQLFLTKRFNIEKNATLEKFIIGNDVFNTLDDSLRDAEIRYERQLLELRGKEERVRHEARNLKQEQALDLTQSYENEARLEEIRRPQRRVIQMAALVVITGLAILYFYNLAEL